MIKLLHNWYLRHFSAPGTIEFAIVLVCSFLTVYYLMWLVGPLVVSLCIAYCLDWLVRLLNHKLKLSRMCSSVITMALFVGVSVGILVFVVPKVLQQGNQFYLNLQKISTETVNSDNGEDFDSNIAARINEFVATMPEPIPSMVTEDELKNMVVNARSVIIANTTNIIKNQVMPSVVNTLSWLMYMIIVPIFVFLMLADRKSVV